MLLLFLLPLLLHACTLSRIAHAQVGTPAGIPSPERYNLSDIQQIFPLQAFQLRNDFTETLVCVDARSDDNIFGTPGGDFSEFTMALHVYSSQLGITLSQDDVFNLLSKFVDEEMTETRPFYFHTDDSKLDQLFKDITSRIGYTPSVVPWTLPANEDVWLSMLSNVTYQGCGHVRLSMSRPSAYGYNDANLVRNTIASFFRAYWRSKTPLRYKFVVKLGALQGKSIAIIKSNGTRCSMTPAVAGSQRGASSFIYTPIAVDDFRILKLVPFFKRQNSKLNDTLMLQTLSTLGQVQLGATLSNSGLAVANQVNVFEITLTISSANKNIVSILVAIVFSFFTCLASF